VKAANDAGIDLNSWDPQKGLDGNAKNVSAVYNFYGKLFLDHVTQAHQGCDFDFLTKA